MTRRWRAVAVLVALATFSAIAGARADVQPRPTPVQARFVLPVAEATVTRPFMAPAHRYAAGHRGVDLGTAPGDTVVAPGDGTVAFTGRVAGRQVLAIDHGGGWRSAVEPVTPVVAEGHQVRRGQPVGSADTGGHCDGSCVHWGVRLDGEYVDPMQLVQVRVILLPLRGRAAQPGDGRSHTAR